MGILTVKHPMFDWKFPDKYYELHNFEIEMKKTFLTNNYNIQESKIALIIMNWLGHEGLRFLQTLKPEEKEKCKTSSGLFKVLRDKFKP